MTSDPSGAPVVLLHHLKHNKVLHEKVILMSIEGEEIPKVAPEGRVELRDLGEGFFQAIGHFGFTESPDVPALLRALEDRGLHAKLRETSFYLGRETLIPNGTAPMSRWRKTAVHRHGPERPVGHRLLQPAAQPGAGAGRPDPALAVASLPGSVARPPLLPRHHFCGKMPRSAPAKHCTRQG